MKKINWADNRNFSLLADFYEFTMSNGYLNCNIDDTISYFDLYFRNVPDKGGFVIASGLEQFVEYIKNLKFSEENRRPIPRKLSKERNSQSLAESTELYRRRLKYPL